MKNYIKKIMPNSLKTILRIARDRCVLSIDMHQQASRFFRSYAKENNQQLACLETRVIFFSHQIEKGLSHKNFRYGFGQQALTNLSYSLKQLKALELDDVKHNYAYCMALSALHEYIQRHSDRAPYDAGKEAGILQITAEAFLKIDLKDTANDKSGMDAADNKKLHGSLSL